MCRSWVVRLVTRAACPRRRTSLEVHQRRLRQRLGLALHRLSHHARSCPTGHAVRSHHPVATFHRPCDVPAGLQAREHDGSGNHSPPGCFPGCLRSTQLPEWVIVLIISVQFRMVSVHLEKHICTDRAVSKATEGKLIEEDQGGACMCIYTAWLHPWPPVLSSAAWVSWHARHFSWVQFRMVPVHSTLSLRSFPNVRNEALPVFVWLAMALSHPFNKDCLALPLSMPLSSRWSMVWWPWLCTCR